MGVGPRHASKEHQALQQSLGQLMGALSDVAFKPHNHLTNCHSHAGLEHGICAVSRQERAFISLPAQALQGGSGTSWPQPPAAVDRIELEVHLRSMVQVQQYGSAEPGTQGFHAYNMVDEGPATSAARVVVPPSSASLMRPG